MQKSGKNTKKTGQKQGEKLPKKLEKTQNILYIDSVNGCKKTLEMAFSTAENGVFDAGKRCFPIGKTLFSSN